MDELSRTQKIIEKFFESDKPLELGMLALNLIITRILTPYYGGSIKCIT